MAFNFFKKEKELSNEEQLARWEKEGRPAPPPHIVKQTAIAEYRKKYNVDILVETGTFLGDMVEAQKSSFKKVYSVELSEKLFKKAQKRFKNDQQVYLFQGDSSTVLNKIIPELKEPALFWLDGHYSGGITALGHKECPVPEELEAIFKSPHQHLILIDDARLFNGTRSYPTLEEIKALMKSAGKDYSIEVIDDIIRLIPT